MTDGSLAWFSSGPVLNKTDAMLQQTNHRSINYRLSPLADQDDGSCIFPVPGCISPSAKSKQGDFIQYDFLEELKNGYVFSPKYESKNKSFPTPHVVVLMNEIPDKSKLSEDRYNIKSLMSTQSI